MKRAHCPGKLRRWLRRLVWLVLGVGLFLLLALLWVFRTALYHHYIQFPQEAAAWHEFRQQWQAVTNNAGWMEYRGVLHSHSEYSHDSAVKFPEILAAMKVARLDFIALSDHCTEGRADFDLQWRGLHEGKLFIPGFEMKEGIMPFGVRAGVALSNKMDSATLAREIVANGGVLFYAHPEEKRDWDRPELTGMEIYNLHTDFKQQRGGLRSMLPDLFLNQRRYPDQLTRLMFRRPTKFLKRWDELNRTRHITGIAGNDCHQNIGLRGFYTAADTIRVDDTSPKTIREFSLNWLTRPLARWWLGPLETNRELFHVQLDPYERSARYVNTHVLARELTEPAILDALRAGRVFIGFDMMADSSSFRWLAQNDAGVAMMGETLEFSNTTRLSAHAPLPCRFTIVHDGKIVHQAEGRELHWSPTAPGKYRVEAELNVRGAWVPWVYANPILLQ